MTRTKTPTATPADLARLKRRKEGDLYRPIIEAFAVRGIYLERRNAGTIAIQGKGKRRVIRAGALGVPDLTGWTTRQVGVYCVKGGERCQTPHPCASGLYVAVEVKRPGWRPSKESLLRWTAQQAYLDRVRQAGGLAWIVRHPSEVKGLLSP